jgi:hypothetical protein
MNPLRILFKYKDTVSFEFRGDLSRAVDRLTHVASKPILQAAFSGELSRRFLVGTVSKEYVRLQKFTPLFGNAFKPIFLGKFQSDKDKNALTGAFEMAPIGKIVVSIFVFFTLAMQILLLPGLVTEGLGIFKPTLFLCSGILLVSIFKLIGKRDVTWIENQIRSALAGNGDTGKRN